MRQISLLFLGLLVVFVQSCKEGSEIDKPEEIIITAEIQNASAYNAADGSVDITISGGESPFLYFWSNGQTTEDANGLRAGTVSVKIIYGAEGRGVAEKTFEITQPEPQPLDLSFAITDAPKYDEPLGSITVSASGGTPPYSYKWNTGDTVATINRLFAGEYQVTVTDRSKPAPITTTGTAEVSEPEFVCGQDSIYDVDRFKYATVEINGQCWMAENLKTIHNPTYPDSLVPIEGRFCFQTYCNGSEGAHYTWEALMDGNPGVTEENPEAEIQGICPDGWHVPTKAEYDALDSYLSVDGNGGAGFFSGAKMKGYTSSSGFDALLIGNWGYGVYNKAAQASFWTANAFEDDEGRLIYLTEDTPFMNSTHKLRSYGLSARCIKNRE